MPAQYALLYYLGSTILGSFILSFLVLLGVNIPNGTLCFDGLGMVVLLSCLIAMIGSLPFHAWLNWVWYKRVATQPYEDFFKSFLRKYWVGSTLCLVVLYVGYVVYFLFKIRENGGKTSTFLSVMELLPFFILWTSYVPLGWWIIRRLKEAMQPTETDV
jgi:cobalamin synthase